MAKRIYTGMVLILLLYLMVQYLSAFGFFIMASASIVIAQLEFYEFYFKNRFAPPLLVGILFGLLVAMSFYFGDLFSERELIANIVIGLLVFVTLYGGKVETSLFDVSITLFGVFYIAWLLGHMIMIRDFLNGKSLLFFLFLVTYSSDTGAYFIGKAFGEKKLCPNISPNKTCVGAVGGVLSSLAMAVIANRLLGTSFALIDILWLGFMLSVVGQVGDLAESMLKRSAGVKDSGSLIPGHGGFLDRIDSLIFTAPVYYYYVFFFIANRHEELIRV